MELKITIKQLGKKQPLLKEKTIEIDSSQSIFSLKELLEIIIKDQVATYNSKSVDTDDEDRIQTPQKEYLQALTETGKAGFGSIYNDKKANETLAVENALQAFEDGIFAVFYGDEEITSLSQTIDLSTLQTFTFIRLTFLAGSFW